MASLTLTITGMHCGNCQKKVVQALQRVAGTYGVGVDLERGTAEVDFDPATADPEQYVAAVASAGYQARVAGAA
jgi:copper chaperone